MLPRGFEAAFRLFYMGVIGNVIFAVAEIAVAAGTIPELQVRILGIRTAANGAAVVVGGRSFLLGLAAHRDRSGFLFDLGGSFDPPGKGKQIEHIFAKENEIIGKPHQGEQILGKAQSVHGTVDHHVSNINEIEQRHDPGLDGDNEKQQELGVGTCGGEAQHQTQIEHKGHIPGKQNGAIAHKPLAAKVSEATKDHAENIHQQNAAEKVKVEFESTHIAFHSPAQGKDTVQCDQGREHIHGHGEHKSHQPPDLALQNGAVVKRKQVKKLGIAKGA